MTRASQAHARAIDIHPAVAGWRAFARTSGQPIAVETIARGDKSAVYRLCGAGPSGTSVVAKAQSPEGLRIERTVYERILPRASVAALRCYGTMEMPDGWCWIFLEDAGGRAYAPESPRDRALAARWLAEMHAATARVKVPAAIARNGIQGYRKAVARVRESLTRACLRGSLAAVDRRTLAGMIRQLEALDARWTDLEAQAAALPPALMHGDFCARNLRVRVTGGATRLAVFDWDMAAWGVCAADLAGAVLESASPSTRVYSTTIRRWLPHINHDAVCSAARAGAILRLIAAMEWELTKSNPPRERWALSNLRRYHALMRGARNGR
jgi:hypothetical protein